MSGTTSIAAGKTFIDGDGNTYESGTADASAIAGKTLRPYSSNTDVSSSLLVLADNASNTAIIDKFDGETYNVTLAGRTLYKDGAWNTLCLPFSMTETQVSAQFAPTALMTLSTTGFSDGTLTLDFENSTAIEAGKPYIIKWDSGDNIVNPKFTGVTVSNTTANVSTDCVDFVGTYSPTDIYTADKTNLYLGGSNTLYYPWADGMTSYYLNANRAYFHLKNGLTAGDPTLSRFVLNFGDGDEAQGITTTDYTDYTDSDGAWYDLNGRKLNKRPTKAGLYISNGRKVVIK